MTNNFALPKEQQELPDKLSAAILACLEDLEACEKNKNYKINMNVWHGAMFDDLGNPLDGPNCICRVCLGGARLARIINNPQTYLNEPYPKPEEKPFTIPHKIEAMDKVRNFDMIWAAKDFYSKGKEYFNQAQQDMLLSLEKDYRGIGNFYEESPVKFKKTLRTIAKKLGWVGL